ncbi:hypothetical protein H5410_064496 [Solanum commersonii]|uniref:Uncharacterized protein n=1 Tax=Solanum commersonii TaxID=4109 RepID=A0A9J5VZ96_SOLCO|nr:hypothetical protein H5410_064496 [Solanum commersonii]
MGNLGRVEITSISLIKTESKVNKANEEACKFQIPRSRAGFHTKPRYHTDGEIEASSWVKSHILELKKTYGVAFEGFREETHALLMKLDERKSVMERKGNSRGVNTSPQMNWQE